jgi:beta-fructofuranosidase
MGLCLADSWLWDSWYAFDGSRHHVFYLQASRALQDPDRRHRSASVGHAVSDDLVTWTVLADALSVSDAPRFDDGTTWTGSVVQDPGGGWRMFYTGTSHADRGLVQRVGWARSPDLTVWTKDGAGRGLEADPRWYEKLDPRLGSASVGPTEPRRAQVPWHDEAWRDPFVFEADDGMWHMLVTSRAKVGAARGRGVVGHCVSRELDRWTVLPPLTRAQAGFGQLEVTSVEVVDDVPVLVFSCGWAEMDEAGRARHGAGGVFSVTGPARLGPFDISQARRFPDDSLYAGRLVHHDGRWHLLGFRNVEDGHFVGALADPTPVTAGTGRGLVPI